MIYASELPAQPSTKRVKARLRRYASMLRNIDNQIERLEQMEQAVIAPPSPNLSGMPSGSGTPSDRTGVMVVRIDELRVKIKEAIKAERAERVALESLIDAIDNPDERVVLQMRYLDRAPWDSITDSLFDSYADYEDKFDGYQKRTFKIHGRALCSLAVAAEQRGE